MRTTILILVLLCGLAMQTEGRAEPCSCAPECEVAGVDPVCGREDRTGHTYKFPNDCYMRCASQCIGSDYKEIDMDECPTGARMM